MNEQAPPPAGANSAPAQKGRLADVALNRIMEMIRAGEYMPGDVLNETVLARHLEMSRGPIREAIRTLQSRKIVTREAYQRARIATFGIKEITELFELREALEGMACRLATERMSDAAISELLDSAAVKRPDIASFVQGADLPNFHTIIVSQCGNSWIQGILTDEVYDLVRFYRWSTSAKAKIPKGRSHEHWQIVRAMQLREPDLAESLMRSHVQHVMSRIMMPK